MLTQQCLRIATYTVKSMGTARAPGLRFILCSFAIPELSILTMHSFKKNTPSGEPDMNVRLIDDDPLAAAEKGFSNGHLAAPEEDFEPVSFSFHNLTYAIKKDSTYQQVLRAISGTVNAGETLAIMGPSGAGKSTLLNILAGRDMKSKYLTGDIFVSDSLLTKKARKTSFKRISGYVMQDDCLLGSLTVMETLTFYAKMRLPFSVPIETKVKKINYILRLLGLEHIKNSLIGTPLSRGISGGERKRVSIAVELITSPALMFVDEPTSGLDGFNAVSVVEALVKLAKQKHTVIFTIHQPRACIFQMFDKLLLLSEGQLVYFGDCSKAIDHFNQVGYPLPMQENPADFLLDLVTLDSRVDTTNKKRAQVESLISQFANSDNEEILNEKHLRFPSAVDESFVDGVSLNTARNAGYKPLQSGLGDAPFLYKVLVMIYRNLLYSFRNVAIVWAKLGTAALIGGIMGSTFWLLGTSEETVQDRINACFFVPVYMALSAMSALPRLIEERLLFIRERSNGTYGTLEYFIAHTLADLPITSIHCLLFTMITSFMIGLRTDASHFAFFVLITFLLSVVGETVIMTVSSVSKTFHFANSVASGILSLNILFGGFTVSPDNILLIWKWIYWVSFFQWGFTATVINEFEGRTFQCDESSFCAYPDGQSVIDSLDIGDRDKWQSVYILVVILIAFKLINYFSLRFITREKN